jgi:O-antigen ligase
MLLDNPVSGVGLDGFLYEYWRRYVEPSGWPERYTSHPHNIILDVWLRLGILGLVAFAALAAAFAVTLRAERRPRPDAASLMAAASAALVAGLVHGLVDNGYFLPDVAAMTWFLIALGAGHAAGAHPDFPSKPSTTTTWPDRAPAVAWSDRPGEASPARGELGPP